MKKVVTRESNKGYYRLLHVPIWLWVFFILPGHLTYDLFTRGFDRRHAIWLGVVILTCAWRGWLGRLPGVEFAPYVTHYGADTPNLGYRVVCYTAAWVDLLVPFALNVIGVAIAAANGQWLMADLYRWLYYPLALAIVAATWLDVTPRARRSTLNEGAERAWFYVAIWVVVPTQSISWAVWRFGQKIGLHGAELGRANLLAILLVGGALAYLGLRGILPRTARYYLPERPASVGVQSQARSAPTGESAD
jgi:hypothetical protein